MQSSTLKVDKKHHSSTRSGFNNLEFFFGTNTIEYFYNATGQKVAKVVTENSTITKTHYLAGGFQYKNNVLQFFPQAEGYVKKEANNYSYVFNYTDHLGNIRLSYTDMDNNGTIDIDEIVEENEYYPFGLKHESHISSNAYQYKFQSQERQDELGLGWDSFKYRNYDFAIGRFMCIDPLAEDYVYNGPYNFSENRVIDGIELEGLEYIPINGNGIRDAFVSSVGQEPTTPQKTENQNNVINGVMNVTFGLVGTVGSVFYIAGSGGVGAAVGGVVALELSLGEVAIGIGQINDAVTNDSGNTNLQKSNTIPGLIAYQNDSPYAPVVDGVAAFAPGTLTGGNIKSMLDTPNNIKNSKSAGEVVFNGLSGYDAYLDTNAAVDGIKTLAPKSSNNQDVNSNNSSKNKGANNKPNQNTSNQTFPLTYRNSWDYKNPWD